MAETAVTKGIVTSDRITAAAGRLAYIKLRNVCRAHGLSVETANHDEIEAVYQRACYPWAIAKIVIRLRERGIVYW